MAHKNTNSAKGPGLKIFAAVTSLLLAASVVITAVGFGTGRWQISSGNTIEAPAGGQGGMIVGETEEQGISLMSAKIAPEDYEEYGISTMAESAYTLTATIIPESADNKAVDWSAEWVDASSEWATGKNVNDYVTVTPESDGALKASLQGLKAFGEQIKVVVTSRSNPNASAECILDYARRITDYRLSTEVGKNVYGTLIDFDEDELLIDFAPVSYDEAIAGLEYYDGSNVWASRIVVNSITSDFYVEPEDENDPLFEAADSSEKFNAQFSDYTLKDNMLFENNVNSEYVADTQIEIIFNSEVKEIFYDYLMHCFDADGGLTHTWVEMFPNGINYVGSNFLTLWRYCMSTSVRYDMSKLESNYEDFLSDIVEWLQANPDTPVWTINVTLTGKYSTFEKTFTVRYDPATVQMPVSGVSLNSTNIVL